MSSEEDYFLLQTVDFRELQVFVFNNYFNKIIFEMFL